MSNSPFQTMLQAYAKQALKHFDIAPAENTDVPALRTQIMEALQQRDELADKIAEFEFRAGCKLDDIPVESLGTAQDAVVNQQAIDTLKRENEMLCKEINRLSSQKANPTNAHPDRAAKAFGSKAEAPYGFKKDGTPRKRPGPPARKRRAS